MRLFIQFLDGIIGCIDSCLVYLLKLLRIEPYRLLSRSLTVCFIFQDHKGRMTSSSLDASKHFKLMTRLNILDVLGPHFPDAERRSADLRSLWNLFLSIYNRVHSFTALQSDANFSQLEVPRFGAHEFENSLHILLSSRMTLLHFSNYSYDLLPLRILLACIPLLR